MVHRDLCSGPGPVGRVLSGLPTLRLPEFKHRIFLNRKSGKVEKL